MQESEQQKNERESAVAKEAEKLKVSFRYIYPRLLADPRQDLERREQELKAASEKIQVSFQQSDKC